MSSWGWRCDRHPQHPSMQCIPAWCCVRLRPISSGSRAYKRVIYTFSKTKWQWKKKIRETMGRLQSAFRCGCFPNERKLRPCYTSHFLTVPFASLLFPVAWVAFYVQLRLPSKTVEPEHQPKTNMWIHEVFDYYGDRLAEPCGMLHEGFRRRVQTHGMATQRGRLPTARHQ